MPSPQGVALRVRAQPAGEVIGSLPPGTEVTLLKGPVLEDEIRWQMIETEALTRTGWVASEYLGVR